MKKGLLVALLAVGFICVGVLSASAGSITWTLIQTAGMTQHSPGSDGIIGTSDDGTAAKCNFTDAVDCENTGNPSTGSYSFSSLTFHQASQCAVATGSAQRGDDCSSNADCGPGVCADCNTGSGGEAMAYFGNRGTSQGNGTYTAAACEGGFEFTKIAIGSSEVISGSGGGCLTLAAGSQSNSGCGPGVVSTLYDMGLKVDLLGSCDFNAGTMPGIDLNGRIYAVGSVSTGTCGYDVAEINDIISDAGLSSGYLMVSCGGGTLPSGLLSACLSDADWTAVMVAKTSTDIVTSCGDACSSGGCMAGTAEGVE